MTNNLRRTLAHIKNAAGRAAGFTLIETLVAVLLLSTAIAAPLTIASKGLSASLIARDQMMAFYLAQDAVEYVRFVRDTNKLSGNPWLTSLDACTGADGCTVDPSSGTIDACSGACAYIKRYDDGAGHVYYSYTDGNQTPQLFRRTVKLEPPPDGATDEEVLTVTVSWRAQSGVTRNIFVRENLLDWQ
jgi:prepilin-type N-terminal cleavage/methylation domain-containing protein